MGASLLVTVGIKLSLFFVETGRFILLSFPQLKGRKFNSLSR